MAENTQLNNLDAQSVEATADPVVPAGNTNDNVAKVNEQANATSSPEMKNVQDLTRYVISVFYKFSVYICRKKKLFLQGKEITTLKYGIV